MTRHFVPLSVTACLIASCTAGGPTVTSAESPSGGTPGPASAVPISTTITSWGAILDRAPASFPRYPGAADASTGSSDPATQSISTGASVATVSDWYGKALSPLGYRQTAIGSPAEDGSVIADFDGGSLAPGCRARLTYRPMGSQTFVFALVGATCPTS